MFMQPSTRSEGSQDAGVPGEGAVRREVLGGARWAARVVYDLARARRAGCFGGRRVLVRAGAGGAGGYPGAGGPAGQRGADGGARDGGARGRGRAGERGSGGAVV